MSLKGNVASLSKFSASLRKIPVVLAQKVTTAAAPKITAAARTTFNAGQDPYGNAWLPGFDGKDVTLVKSGALSRGIRYVAIGTKLRVALGVPYAKYQISRRPVFPRQGGALPTEYSRTLATLSHESIREVLSDAA